jgi:hypothetical protein
MDMTRTVRFVALASLVAAACLVASPASAILYMYNGSGKLWDIDNSGTYAPPSDCGSGHINNGTRDAYDTFGFLCVTASGATFTTKCVAADVYCGHSTVSTEMSGLQLVLGEDSLQGLTVQRRVYVPDSGGADTDSFLRYLDTFHNATGSPITVQLRFGSASPGTNALGSDSYTVCTDSDDGDATVETTDRWITTDDYSTTSGDPSLGFVIQGAGGAETCDYFALNAFLRGYPDEVMWAFDAVTVPAGETIAFITFMIQEDNQTLAVVESRAISLTPADTYAGMTTEQLGWVKNFSFTGDSDGDGYRIIDGDCDDTDDEVHPGITADPCDGKDNDCSPSTPDGVSESWFGTPCDGSDADLCEDGYLACIGGSQGCNDDTAAIADVCDGIDNDCNPGSVDGSGDTRVGVSCDGPDLDLCPEGSGTCVSGAYVCTDTTGDSPDPCDDSDNDCDSSTPDGWTESWYGTPCDGGDPDFCEYGYEDCISGSRACNESSTGVPDICDGEDNDCNPTTPDGHGDERVGVACDGPDPDWCKEGVGLCVDGAFVCTDTEDRTPEICDGIDNDCTVATADGTDEEWYGQPCDGSDVDLCEEGTWDCVASTKVCNDVTDNIQDFCDNVDNDCDPETEDGYHETWLGDACDGPDRDLCAEGQLMCDLGEMRCNDFSDDNLEVCNGVDDDCDPFTLETGDNDGDGPSACDGDCNDFDPTIYPGAPEPCDGIDHDCDRFTDHDGDGDTVRDCEGDCQPMNPNIYPGAEEICNDTVDNDCDMLIDGRDPECGGQQVDDISGCSCSAVPGAGRAGLAWLAVLGLVSWWSRRRIL